MQLLSGGSLARKLEFLMRAADTLECDSRRNCCSQQQRMARGNGDDRPAANRKRDHGAAAARRRATCGIEPARHRLVKPRLMTVCPAAHRRRQPYGSLTAPRRQSNFSPAGGDPPARIISDALSRWKTREP
jgi:hypothetical protein